MNYDPNQAELDNPPPPPVTYQPPEGNNPGNLPPPAGNYGAPPPPGYAAPGYAGQPAYYGAYGAYPGPMAPATSGWAIASLVASIASFLGFPFIGGILGAIFGHLALGEIKRSEGRVVGHGMAMAGLIVGYINVGLTLCVVAGIIAVGIIGAAGAR
ncbi:MAG TPA: DUF4190 domain-containing protein [Ktedonobacterales bacterium]